MTASGMSLWLIGLARVSAEAGALVLVVLFVQTLLRKQLTPRWRCALWLLVVVRLLLPVSIGSRFSVFNLVPTFRQPVPKSAAPENPGAFPDRGIQFDSTPAEPVQTLPEPNRNVSTFDDSVAPGEVLQETPATPSEHRDVVTQASPGTRVRRFAWPQILFAIWFCGAFLLTAYVAAGSIRLMHCLAGLPVVTDVAVLAALSECRQRLGVRAKLTVVESAEISTPALHGLFRLRLILPRGFARGFSPVELRFVLLHELAHVKRCDIPLNWLVTLLQVVHWFNPLLWFGFARWRADRELACDAMALEAAGPELNKEYGRTILKLLESFTHRATAPGLVGILEDKRRLRQRIRMIAGFRPNRRWRFASALLLAGLALVCLTDAQGPRSSVEKNEAVDAHASVTATVVDEQGRPVPGATVECYHYQTSSVMMGHMLRKPELKQQLVTDARGTFMIPASPDTILVVAKKPGLAPAWRTWPFEGDDSPEPLVLTTPTTLSGVVVDEKGQPVAGAEVWASQAAFAIAIGITSQRNDIFGPPSRECFSARTSADGHFRIENFPADARALLIVSKPGMAQRPTTGGYFGSREYQSGQQNVKLLLGPAGAIEGNVVVQETGQPVANVEVWLLPTTGEAMTHGPIRSSADGSFRIPDLQPATYNVWPVVPGQPPDFVEGTNNRLVTVTAGLTNRDTVIRLTTGVLVEVSVVSTNDLKPLANVAVSCGRATGYTDSNGKTLLRVSPGKAWLSAVKTGWSLQNTTAQIESGRANRVTIQMFPPPRISGVVRDSAGAPARGVRVSFHPGRYPVAPFYTETTTDKDGRYEMTIRQDSRTTWFWSGPINPTNFVLAQDFGRNLAAIDEFGTSETNFSQLGTMPTNLDLTLQPGITISGSVQDTDGAPITSAMIDLKILSGRSFASVENKPVNVDGRGSFSYSALPQGYQYDCFDVTAKGYGTSGGFVDAKNTRTNHYEFPAFVLKRADRVLTGTVLDREGKPVAGATLFISGPGQITRYNVISDDEGRFSVDGICAGELKVDARYYPTPRDYSRSEQGDVSAQGGDTNVVVRLGIYGYDAGQYLSQPLQTVGIVRDSSGAAVPGATVSLFPSQAGIVLSQTDSNGRYEVHWQARQSGLDGTTWLLARDSSRNLSSLRQIDKQTTNLDLSLQPGLGLAVQVRETDGQAVTNATAMVSLWPGGNNGYSVERKHFAADDQGWIRVAGLPQGYAYNVSVEASNYTSGTRLVGVDDTETNFLELQPVVLTPTDTDVAGIVLDAEGKPAGGVQVQIFAAGKTVSTTADSNGHFQLHNLSRGRLTFYAGFPIPSSTALSNSGTVGGKGGDTNIVVRLGTGRGPSAPEPFVTTAGTVFDMTGAPAGGVSVAVLPSAGLNGSLRTDSNGHFSVQWRPTILRSSTWTNRLGKAVVFARDEEHNLAGIAETDPSATNVNLHLQPGYTLSGVVRDADRIPITNATVQLAPFPPSDLRSGMNRMPPINADAQGRFSIKALPVGAPYAAYVTAPGYGVNNVQVTANETYLNELQLPPIALKSANLQVSGQVFDLNGKPCQGARLFVEGDGQPARSFGSDATSDANGHFVIRRVCEGPLVVRATLPASAERPQYLVGTADAHGGDTNVVLNLRYPNAWER